MKYENSYRAWKLRGTEKEWLRRWCFHDSLDITSYDDDESHSIGREPSRQYEEYKPRGYDIHSIVHVKRVDRNGNVIEEKDEEHFYEHKKGQRLVATMWLGQDSQKKKND